MTAVAGLRGTGDWGTDERPKSFREMILWRMPNGNTPLTALMAKMKKQAVDDPEFNWYDESEDIIRLQVNFTTGYAAGATTIVVDGTDPTTTDPTPVFGNARHLKAGDLLLVEKATDTTTYNNEIVMVSSVSSSTQLVITRAIAGTSADTIADNTFLTKIGSAYGEGTSEPTATSRQPRKYNNYAQIFKTVYELTRTAASVKNMRTGDPLSNERLRKSRDHARDLEFGFLFGQKYEDTDPSNGKPRRFTGGLRSFIPAARTTIFATTPTMTSMFDAIYPVFDWDSDAGDERIVFAGNGFLNSLNKLASNSGQMNYDGIVTQWGMKLNRFVMPQGSIYVRTHPLLNRHGKYTFSAFVLDPTKIIYRPFMDTKFIDDIQTKGQDTRKGLWITEAGIEVQGGGMTMAFLGNFVV